MSDTPTSLQIAARAQALRQWAERLARDFTLPRRQSEARAALRDIAEAEKWLRQPDAANRPHVLAIAVTELDMVEHLLTLIDEATPTKTR